VTEDVKRATIRRPNRREVAAAQTRREILNAARRLFAEQGFAGTPMQQIAEEAGVAVQTIYSSVGSKSALVLALGDLIEEEADAPALNAQIAQQSDPGRLLATGVHLTRQLNERCGDILEVLFTATSAEPDAAALVAEGIRRHDRGASQAARRLAALGALAPGTTPERAAAVISVMTSPATWRQLTQHSRWTFDEAETWLTAALTRLLLNRSG
jgi:AcrR family transcriptional regulator